MTKITRPHLPRESYIPSHRTSIHTSSSFPLVGGTVNKQPEETVVCVLLNEVSVPAPQKLYLLKTQERLRLDSVGEEAQCGIKTQIHIGFLSQAISPAA